ncbi:MAG: hypothetical protein ACRCXE_03285 [Metamycoplasmataceae bacterium]
MEEKKVTDEISQVEKLEAELKEIKLTLKNIEDKGFLIDRIVKNDEEARIEKETKLNEELKIKMENEKLIKGEF